MSDNPKYTKPTVSPLGRTRRPVAERFWEKVNRTNGCWLWTSHKDPLGYGRFSLNGSSQYAHRIAYEMEVGAIPSELEIDHLCNVRNCVRPDHLKAVTHRENWLRSSHPRARAYHSDTCHNGHLFTTDNTRYTKNGRRLCKACRAEYQRRYRARLKSKPTP